MLNQVFPCTPHAPLLSREDQAPSSLTSSPRRIVSPTLDGSTDDSSVDSSVGMLVTPTPIRLVVDRASPHSTRTVTAASAFGTKRRAVKVQRRLKVVRFQPMNNLAFRCTRTDAGDSSTAPSTWVDPKHLIISQYKNRKRAAYFASKTKVAQAIEKCLSKTDVNFDPTDSESVAIQQELLANHASRGLESRISPRIKQRRITAMRQVVLMARKLASDNFLDANTQAQWVADRSRKLSVGSVRLARHLAEADANMQTTS